MGEALKYGNSKGIALQEMSLGQKALSSVLAGLITALLMVLPAVL